MTGNKNIPKTEYHIKTPDEYGEPEANLSFVAKTMKEIRAWLNDYLVDKYVLVKIKLFADEVGDYENRYETVLEVVGMPEYYKEVFGLEECNDKV